jgi:hypothetical protein
MEVAYNLVLQNFIYKFLKNACFKIVIKAAKLATGLSLHNVKPVNKIYFFIGISFV